MARPLTITRKLAARTDLTWIEKAIYMVIKSTPDWPGVATLAAQVGVSRDSVIRSLQALQHAELIVIKPGARGQRHECVLAGDGSVLPLFGGAKPAQLPPIPDSLGNPDFRETWADWVKYRKQIHKPLTPIGAARSFTALQRFGPGGAIAALTTAMEKGWQGFFEPDKEHTAPIREPDKVLVRRFDHQLSYFEKQGFIKRAGSRLHAARLWVQETEA